LSQIGQEILNIYQPPKTPNQLRKPLGMNRVFLSTASLWRSI